MDPVGSLLDGTQGGGIPDGEREVSGVVLCNAPRGQGILIRSVLALRCCLHPARPGGELTIKGGGL